MMEKWFAVTLVVLVMTGLFVGIVLEEKPKPVVTVKDYIVWNVTLPERICPDEGDRIIIIPCAETGCSPVVFRHWGDDECVDTIEVFIVEGGK